jgi:serine/threonine protein kinase
VGADQDLVAQALPSYEVGDEIGQGAFGVVYRGRHKSLGRDVAIKQLPASVAVDDTAAHRFETEARLVAGFDHPHIVPVFDYVDADGVALLVMEYMGAGTLKDRTDSGMAPEEMVATVVAVLAALEYAHQRDVLHRDLKPENVLFSANTPKLADFGIAKVLQADHTLTQAGSVLGTPRYMSPEAAAGDPLTASADVYALACVLYEMLAGRLPFPPADSVNKEIIQRVNDAPVPLATANPDIDAGLAAVVDRALTHDVADRYATAESFARDLATAATQAFGPGWLHNTGIPVSTSATIVASTETVERPAAVESPPGQPSRGGLLVGVGLFVAVLLLLGGALVLLSGDDDQAASDTTQETDSPGDVDGSPVDGPRATASDGDEVSLELLVTFKVGCEARGVDADDCVCIRDRLLERSTAAEFDVLVDRFLTSSTLPPGFSELAEPCGENILGGFEGSRPSLDRADRDGSIPSSGTD